MLQMAAVVGMMMMMIIHRKVAFSTWQVPYMHLGLEDDQCNLRFSQFYSVSSGKLKMGLQLPSLVVIHCVLYAPRYENV